MNEIIIAFTLLSFIAILIFIEKKNILPFPFSFKNPEKEGWFFVFSLASFGKCVYSNHFPGQKNSAEGTEWIRSNDSGTCLGD